VLLTDIETYLATFAPWTQSGTTYTIRTYFTPDTPDAVIVLREFPAGESVYGMGPSLRAPLKERIGLMVSVRGPQKSPTNERLMAEAVHLKLSRFKGTLGGRAYYIEEMHGPAPIDQDRNSRWGHEMNYVVMKDSG
jgi:hypothetical protein